MKDEIIYLDEEKKYPLIFNLNVMEIIQKEYGSLKKWQESIFVDRENGDKEENKEPKISDVIFGIREMMNEAVDILNEEQEEKYPLFTDKQVGRIVTKVGLTVSKNKIGESILIANKVDNPKNE